MTDDSSPKSWHQQPDEPPDWFNRFHTYLTLGPSRTLTAAYREWAKSKGSPSSTASQQYNKWNWKERAMAFDQANREEKAAFEAVPRRRSSRIPQPTQLNNKILEAVATALRFCRLEKSLTTDEARALLPSLRGYLYATTAELQRRELQSTQDHDQLPSSSGWPVLDPIAEKILDRFYADEE